MFSGTVFVRQRQPDHSLQLPRSCWDVYERLDGERSIGEIAAELGLSQAETFAVIRQLQRRDLIEEPVLSYPAYQKRESADQNQEVSAGSSAPSVPEMTGDGAVSAAVNGNDSVSSEAAGADNHGSAIHLPTLWNWLQDAANTVKSYKNTQAFVLMEASDALEAVGVGNMEELEDMERCNDAKVIEALETAVENNVNESIPTRCYR